MPIRQNAGRARRAGGHRTALFETIAVSGRSRLQNRSGRLDLQRRTVDIEIALRQASRFPHLPRRSVS